MSDLKFIAKKEQVTLDLAQKMASVLRTPFILTLSGEIGAGKTTFVRALLQALGVSTAIKSPTYSLIESYVCGSFEVHHMDLYRIQDDEELEYLGYRDYFQNHAVCCIEWPERIHHQTIPADLNIRFAIQELERHLCFHPLTLRGEEVVTCLRAMHDETSFML